MGTINSRVLKHASLRNNLTKMMASVYKYDLYRDPDYQPFFSPDVVNLASRLIWIMLYFYGAMTHSSSWIFGQTQVNSVAQMGGPDWITFLQSSSNFFKFAKHLARPWNRHYYQRYQCVSEGLDDTVVKVMSETGVSEHELELWESLTINHFINQGKLQLGELRGLNSDELRIDRLTRTNEWMLGVFNASPDIIDLHRPIIALEINRHQRTIGRPILWT